MTNKIPFQYAILQYRHDLVTGEFLNIGLALYSKEKQFFQVRLLTKYSRLTDAFPGSDGEFYRKYIGFLQRKFDKLSKEIMIPQFKFTDNKSLGIRELLNSVLPKDDSSIIFDHPKGGVSEDIEGVFSQLYDRLVEYYLHGDEKGTRSDEDVWSSFSKPLKEQDVLAHLRPHIVRTSNDTLEFEYAFKNGRWSLFQPVSFDLTSATYIKRKARLWLGNQMVLKHSAEILGLYLLLGKPKEADTALAKSYGEAKDILSQEEVGYKREIIEEDEATDFAKDIKSQVEHE